MPTTSTINPLLTLDYIKNEPENKYFDRKDARIKPTDLAQDISGFANAEGATIVIGVNRDCGGSRAKDTGGFPCGVNIWFKLVGFVAT